MKKKDKNILIGIVGVIVLIIVLNLTLKSQPAGILPSGQYNLNSDCSFITNTEYGLEEGILDYKGESWVSVDWDGDGVLEGYGFVGYLWGDDVCLGKQIIANTPIGFDVVKYAQTLDYKEIAICGSITATNSQAVYHSARRYRDTSSNSINAILTCEAIPSGCHTNLMGSWDYCRSSCKCNAGEGDCDADSQCAFGTTCVKNVGSNYGFPSGMDFCESIGTPTPPSPSPCISFDELMNVANRWATC